MEAIATDNRGGQLCVTLSGFCSIGGVRDAFDLGCSSFASGSSEGTSSLTTSFFFRGRPSISLLTSFASRTSRSRRASATLSSTSRLSVRIFFARL